MKCKSKQYTVFDEAGLKLRLSKIENEEQNPEIYSIPEKIKALGIEKKAIVDILDKINLTTRQVEDLFVLFDMISVDGTEDDWKGFENDFKIWKIRGNYCQ